MGVRELIKFIRKRDKRVQMYSKKLAEKREQNKKKTAEKRKKQLDAQAKVLQDALQQVDEGNGGFGMKDMEDELRVLEDQLDADDVDELFCVACNKEMRNEKAFASHRKQKKHLENVEKLRETLLQDDLINSDELNSESDVEVQGEEIVNDNLLKNSKDITNSEQPEEKTEVKNTNSSKQKS